MSVFSYVKGQIRCVEEGRAVGNEKRKPMFRQYTQLGPVNLVKVKLRIRHKVTIAFTSLSFSLPSFYVLQIQEEGFIQG